MSEQPTDAERMDWFSGGVDRQLYQCIGGEWCAQEDWSAYWYGDSPRAAIDAALTATKIDLEEL